jgi:hypothetical protein
MGALCSTFRLLVYLLVMSEEFLKWFFGMFRFISRKWIHNVAQTVELA